jgi:hypothetical protein
MDQVLNKRAVFVGCARDCAMDISRVLSNVSRMAAMFAESAFVFIENDSHDATKSTIQAWCRGRPNAQLVSLDGLATNCPVRTIRLATVRNRYLSLLRSDFRAHDLVFVLDCDDTNAREIELDAVVRAVEFLARDPTHAGVFANSRDEYYDLWALRHPLRCPGDVWEEVCDYAIEHRVSDEEAYRRTFANRIFSLPVDAPPLEVDSAFGGLGIYKIASLLRNKREYVGHKIKLISGTLPGSPENRGEVGWQCCEHVSFNSGFREVGERLHVMPDLVNKIVSNIPFPPSGWREMIFSPHLIPGRSLDVQNAAASGKIGRNQQCPCGSGKKYKHCHGSLA